jgi:hypothetical protein
MTENKSSTIVGHTLQRAEQEANARLIAAAPELLALLREVSLLLNAGAFPNIDPTEPWVSRLRAAIAKAEGGQ